MRELQRKQLDSYTIHIVNSTEILNAQAEVRDQLTELTHPQKNTEYQIGFITMGPDFSSAPTRYYAELWAYNSTTENKKLDNMVIKGRKIQVYPMSPVPSDT